LKSPDNLALKNATLGRIVLQKGSLHGRRTTTCTRAKDSPPFALLPAVALPTPHCTSYGPDDTPPRIYAACTAIEYHDACITSIRQSIHFEHLAPLDSWALDNTPTYPCSFNQTAVNAERYRFYPVASCTGSPTETIDFDVSLILELFPGHLLGNYWMGSYTVWFDGLLPGSPPFSLASDITVTNAITNTPNIALWCASITLSLSPP
jgi:hypothetical protein